jgi:hypothetical protein
LSVEKPLGPDSVTVGHYFSQTLRASGNSGPISWDIAEGALPRGLSLDSKSGLIVGTPTTVGQFTFIARVSDTLGRRVQREFTIAVLKPTHNVGTAQSENSGKKAADQAGATGVGRQSSLGTAAGSSNPPPCKSPTFNLEQYGDSRTGELLWPGVLSSGFHLDIVGNLYKLSWNLLAHEYPTDSFYRKQRPAGHMRPESAGSSIFQGSIGDLLLGDPLPKGVPVRVSVSPKTVRITTAPSAANCWASVVVLDESRGTTVSGVRIKWEVFQP